MLCLKGKISRKILVTLIYQEDVIAGIKMYVFDLLKLIIKSVAFCSVYFKLKKKRMICMSIASYWHKILNDL
jgi:hypothetical protein